MPAVVLMKECQWFLPCCWIRNSWVCARSHQEIEIRHEHPIKAHFIYVEYFTLLTRLVSLWCVNRFFYKAGNQNCLGLSCAPCRWRLLRLHRLRKVCNKSDLGFLVTAAEKSNRMYHSSDQMAAWAAALHLCETHLHAKNLLLASILQEDPRIAVNDDSIFHLRKLEFA